MYLNFHLIRTYPAANINRDDTGQPKKMVQGGVTRSLVSSQCLKYNWKHSDVFETKFTETMGIRTKHIRELVYKACQKHQTSEEATKAIFDLIFPPAQDDENKKNKKDQKKGKKPVDDAQETNSGIDVISRNSTLLYFNKMHFDNLVEHLAKAHYEDGKNFSKIKLDTFIQKNGLDKVISPDVALFGSMSTVNYVNPVVAAASVSPAISTHGIESQFDYFAAMDDLNSDTGGAGHLDSKEFNSSTLREWYGIHVDQLLSNLEDTEKTIDTIVTSLFAIIASNPKGYKNSFGSCGLYPNAILIDISYKNHEINYSNAFEKPVKADKDGGYIIPSVNRLLQYAHQYRKTYDIIAPEKQLFLGMDIDDAFDTSKYIPSESICGSTSELLYSLEKILVDEIKK